MSILQRYRTQQDTVSLEMSNTLTQASCLMSPPRPNVPAPPLKPLLNASTSQRPAKHYRCRESVRRFTCWIKRLIGSRQTVSKQACHSALSLQSAQTYIDGALEHNIREINKLAPSSSMASSATLVNASTREGIESIFGTSKSRFSRLKRLFTCCGTKTTSMTNLQHFDDADDKSSTHYDTSASRPQSLSVLTRPSLSQINFQHRSNSYKWDAVGAYPMAINKDNSPNLSLVSFTTITPSGAGTPHTLTSHCSFIENTRTEQGPEPHILSHQSNLTVPDTPFADQTPFIANAPTNRLLTEREGQQRHYAHKCLSRLPCCIACDTRHCKMKYVCHWLMDIEDTIQHQ
jgi:hypothetical protein